MTTEQLRGIAEEVFVQMLTQRVVEKLLERQKQALVVCTGADIGMASAMKAMRRLRDEGFTFQILLSQSAAMIYPPAKLREELAPENIWVGDPPEIPEALAYRYDTILVPAMTIRTAAHVAACTADTPSSAVILDGLLRGKNVVINIDGCCPDNPERIRRGYHMVPALRQKLRDNLETLRSYGARLANSDNFDEKVRAAVLSDFRTGAQPQQRREEQSVLTGHAALIPASGQEIRLHMEGRILSGRHLNSCPDGSFVRVPKETMITQLAADEARRRNITIRKET